MKKLLRNVSESIRMRNGMCQLEKIDKFILELSCHILIMSAKRNRLKLATLSVKSNQNKL